MISVLKFLFWIFLFVVFYTYIGYGILLYFLISIKRVFFPYSVPECAEQDLPEVTLLISAYNEEDFILSKVKNSAELDYPKNKLRQIWITDGTTDGSNELLKTFKDIEVYHQEKREGKIAAVNRGMEYVKTPIVIFSDANTFIGKDSIKRMVALFNDPKVGAVSGEKRIFKSSVGSASNSGERFYWKYESLLKKWDSELYSVVGAAGELFAIRTKLWEDVEPDTLLDDFIISMRIAMAGYTVKYDPEAYAIETSSLDIKEEKKRKIRISAGGIQSVIRLRKVLNIFKYGVLSFQYISHRFLRWTVTPFLLPLLIIINFTLFLHDTRFGIYSVFFYAQLLFYAFVFIGWLLHTRKIRLKFLYIPYYFWLMNTSVFQGIKRLITGNQSVIWEKAKRDPSFTIKN